MKVYECILGYSLINDEHNALAVLGITLLKPWQSF
jgi:hypothetical protein